MHGVTAARKAFDPRNIPDCRCWLRADMGIILNGSTVKTWVNQVSGVPGNATESGTFDRPSYAAGVNGRPCVRFDAASSQLMDWSLDIVGEDPKTIAIVAKLASEPGTGFSLYSLKDVTASTFSELLIDLNTYQYNSFVHACGAWDSSGHSDSWGTSLARVHVHSYAGGGGAGPETPGNYSAAFNGAVKTAVASGAFARDGLVNGSIGRRDDIFGGFSFDGEIYEIIVYRRVLTAQEAIDLWGYLKARYAL